MSQSLLSRVGAVGLAVALAGCAIKTPHLAINQWPVTSRALYYHEAAPSRIAVLPLADRRPAQEQQGQQAPATFLVIWNRRSGDYYTGDHIYGPNVAGQLSAQVADYLKAANTFTEVINVPSPPSDDSPATLRAIAQQYNADYLLGGEVKHFFGSQHQHFSMWVLPLFFITAAGWSDAKGLPWGQTTVQFYLVDGKTGDTIWRHQLEASDTRPRETDSMAEAAMESFTRVAGDLATELRQLPLGSSYSTVASSER